MLVSGVQQTFRIRHDSPMDLKKAREHAPHYTGNKNTHKRPGHGGNTAAVKPIYQGNDKYCQCQSHRQSHPNRIPALQIQRNKHFPNHKDRQEKGQHRTQSCPSGKKDQQQDKHCRQQQFPWSTVVIDHGDTQYFPILIVDSDQCLVACGKKLILLQGAI